MLIVSYDNFGTNQIFISGKFDFYGRVFSVYYMITGHQEAFLGKNETAALAAYLALRIYYEYQGYAWLDLCNE